MITRLQRTMLAAPFAAALTVGLIAGCSSNGAEVNEAGGPPASPTLVASQDGTSTDPTVYSPFYLVGKNYAANAAVTLGIYANNSTTKPLFTQNTTADANGAFSTLTTPTGLTAGTQYDAWSTVGGKMLVKEDLTFQGPRINSLTKVLTDGKAPAGRFISPAVRNSQLFLAQSNPSGGSIYRWSLGSLPKQPSATPVVDAPNDTFVPAVPPNVKMEQINFDAKNQNMYIGLKAQNQGTTGGNNISTYGFKGNQTTGPGTVLAGDPSVAYLPWNDAASAYKYTTTVAFPPPNGSTTTPTKVTIGNGGGVAQANNGFLYFSSLQSSCVYKQNLSTNETWPVYCLQNWGVTNYNQSVYSLDTDVNGNVYAVYQGSSDNNTMILKIVPGGNGASTDKVSAIQLTGYMLSVGLTVNNAGTSIFTNGAPVTAGVNNNTILQINNPTWGPAVSWPNAVVPTQVTDPIAVTIPDTPVNGTPWLQGMTLNDKTGVKGDRIYIADNNSGFWIMYL